MRTFVLFAEKARTSKFSLNDLPGSGGRMDLVCRCVNAALWVSHGLRRDTDIYLVLNGSPSMKRVSPDERNIAAWVNKSIEKASGKDWERVQEGIDVSRKGFEDILKELRDRPIYVMHEEGKPIKGLEMGESPVFVLGDHMGLPEEQQSLADKYSTKKLSLGKKPYLASHCMTIINYELDKN